MHGVPHTCDHSNNGKQLQPLRCHNALYQVSSASRNKYYFSLWTWSGCSEQVLYKCLLALVTPTSRSFLVKPDSRITGQWEYLDNKTKNAFLLYSCFWIIPGQNYQRNIFQCNFSEIRSTIWSLSSWKWNFKMPSANCIDKTQISWLKWTHPALTT